MAQPSSLLQNKKKRNHQSIPPYEQNSKEQLLYRQQKFLLPQFNIIESAIDLHDKEKDF